MKNPLILMQQCEKCGQPICKKNSINGLCRNCNAVNFIVGRFRKNKEINIDDLISLPNLIIFDDSDPFEGACAKKLEKIIGDIEKQNHV